MGLEKIGTTTCKEIIAWVRTGANKSLLATRPVKVNTDGLRLASKLEGDVVQFTPKETKLDEELFEFLPWRRGYKKLPPKGKPPIYTPEAREATESFIEKGWIEKPLPNGFRIYFGPYRAFNAEGGIKASFQIFGKSGSEALYFNEQSKGIKMMVERLEKIYSETPNLTEEGKAKILHRFVDSCYDKNRSAWINQFCNDFIPIENTAASGAGVCRHKSFLAKVLGDKLGMHIAMARGHYIVVPELGIPESHIWNEIKINDKWYLMDVEQGRFKDLAQFPEFSDLYLYK